MLPHLLEKTTGTPRDKLFWSVLLALVAGQVVALWMLCSHQVRKAEVRDASIQVERTAMADCLKYIPRATLNSCAGRVVPQAATPPNTLSTTVPVNFALR